MKECYRYGVLLVLTLAVFGEVRAQDANDPGVLEPVLTATTGADVRIPHTDQADGATLLNIVGPVRHRKALGMRSLTGHPISRVTSPNDDMREALKDLEDAAKNADTAAMQAAAADLMDILQGTTQGRIYDGFAMLNYNRGAFLPDQEPGEYKMKRLRDTGLTETGIDGETRKIWEADVSLLYYDGQIDADCFLLVMPVEMHEFDVVRINYTIYSLEREDFSPTVVMMDHRLEGSVQFPFKGLDAVWTKLRGDEVARLTVAYPPNRLLRGVYTWGWRVHPPRIQFLQPVWEHVNAYTGLVELEPQGLSFATRNRELTLDGIGDAAPEKKMYTVAQAVLDGVDPATIEDWLTREDQGPRGTWDEWADLAANQRQLPPEAWDVLAEEGISPGNFGPYRFVSAYVNNEMYGEGPAGAEIDGWFQGDVFQVKLINLDNHTHYFRNVDFGTRLHDDIANCCSAGSHSFEIMNFKPTYGAPKVAEVQWRAGWGFRPHNDIIQQQDVFPRTSDQVLLKAFFGGFGDPFFGYQYSAARRGGDFRFNPPGFIITNLGEEPPFPLREADGTDGLLVGQLTEGYGVARMCDAAEFPLGGFCERDISAYNPNGVYNVDSDGDGVNDVLWFPPFLRNPNTSQGGDIIPPTPAWKPFLWINPNNGTLYLDPADPGQGYWVDLTYAHGAPVYAGAALNASIEAPRGSAQVFYQFDDLFHDNDIFSPHPTFESGGPLTRAAAPVDEATPSEPAHLGASRVYPNPFNPRATVEYEVLSPGRVKMTVYNMLGQRVFTATAEHATTGTQRFTLDGSRLGSGQYLIRITDASGQGISKLVTLLK